MLGNGKLVPVIYFCRSESNRVTEVTAMASHRRKTLFSWLKLSPKTLRTHSNHSQHLLCCTGSIFRFTDYVKERSVHIKCVVCKGSFVLYLLQYTHKHSFKSRSPPQVSWREICSSNKRSQIWSKPNTHWPATAFSSCLMRKREKNGMSHL